MVLFLFDNVIYVFLLLWLRILVVCLCMTTLTEGFPCFFLSCKANARVKSAKTGHGPHSSQFLCCSMYCLFCVVLCIVCVCIYVYCTTATIQLQINISYQIIFIYLFTYLNALLKLNTVFIFASCILLDTVPQTPCLVLIFIVGLWCDLSVWSACLPARRRGSLRTVADSWHVSAYRLIVGTSLCHCCRPWETRNV
jgi:hypothetical protein